MVFSCDLSVEWMCVLVRRNKNVIRKCLINLVEYDCCLENDVRINFVYYNINYYIVIML